MDTWPAISDNRLENLIRSPSLGAVSYQASHLVDSLREINEYDFPPQAQKLRDVFLCLAEYILGRLENLSDPDNPGSPRGGEEGGDEMRELATRLHSLFSFVRYLSASSPHQAPPAIQTALTQLTDLHFPKENGDPICIIRPQWKYNLTYVAVNILLEKKILTRSVLDPDGLLDLSESSGLLGAIWEKWAENERLRDPERRDLSDGVPNQLAVLSFAGLDTQDALFFPLLAHELGHFIDYSHVPQPLNLGSEILHAADITVVDVGRELGKENSAELVEIWRRVINKRDTCLRELLADLLAVRMVGFGFFAAQGEFLKTVSSWEQPVISDAGYPEIKFRLFEILKHLVADDAEGNISAFLEQHKDEEVSKKISTYLDFWEKRLNEIQTATNADPIEEKIRKLIEKSVRAALPHLCQAAKSVIKDEDRAILTPNFFERVKRLMHDLPPSIQNEVPHSFAEISSATWAYQVVYGEERENKEATLDRRQAEYGKTCRLLLKAIELIPARNISGESNEEGTVERDALIPLEARPGVLASTEIRRRIELPISDKRRIEIMPFSSKLINAASLDVRLGNWFSVARKTKLRGIEIGNPKDEALLTKTGREHIFVHPDKSFLLHPGDLVLGITQEFVALPNDVMAFVEGKSRLGRMGLIVATAAQVAPGFHGVIVLELANTGTIPLELKPGRKIAQIVFQSMSNEVPDSDLYHAGKQFYCQIKP